METSLRRLLLTAVSTAVVGLWSACFIPPGDNYLNNRPPRIRREPDLLSPSTPLIRIGDANACQPLLFSVRVEDPDLDDTIQFNWLVDDRPDTGTSSVISAGLITNPELKKLRETPITFRTIPRLLTSPLYSKQAHIVEVVVADNTLVGRTPQPIMKYRNSVADQAYADSYAWVVITETDVTCP